MSRYLNGQPIYLSTTVKDRTGTLVDATALTLTVQKPDLTQQVYSSPTHDSTGNYHQDIPASDLSQNGHYQYVWVATGTGAGASRGDFDVFDPFEPAILPLQDAKDAANIPQGTTTYDFELQSMIDTITVAVETITGGPLYNRTITNERQRVTGFNDNTFVVRYRPIVSVTSITNVASGQSIPLTDLDIDTNSNTIMRKRELPFWGWAPWYLITYVAGWGTSIPVAFNVAARMIVQHYWETQRGPGQRPQPGLDETFLPGMAYAIPNRALEILRPYTLEAYF